MEAIGFRDVSAFLTGIKRNLYHLFCLPGIVLCGKITILVQVCQWRTCIYIIPTMVTNCIEYTMGREVLLCLVFCGQSL